MRSHRKHLANLKFAAGNYRDMIASGIYSPSQVRKFRRELATTLKRIEFIEACDLDAYHAEIDSYGVS
jgi:hypothetical protein